MRYETVTVRHGENCGPIDWQHPIAKDMPPIWREAEKRPEDFVFSCYERPILKICMYDGWPYWTPRPAVHFIGPIGAEWTFFDSYGVDEHSIQPRPAQGIPTQRAETLAAPFRGSPVAESDAPEPGGEVA